MTITTVTTSTTITGGGGALISSSTIDEHLQNASAGPGNNISSGNVMISTAIKGERNLTLARLNLIESPPEAAIEATPETTPFVTPVKASVLNGICSISNVC